MQYDAVFNADGTVDLDKAVQYTELAMKVVKSATDKTWEDVKFVDEICASITDTLEWVQGHMATAQRYWNEVVPFIAVKCIIGKSLYLTRNKHREVVTDLQGRLSALDALFTRLLHGCVVLSHTNGRQQVKSWRAICDKQQEDIVDQVELIKSLIFVASGITNASLRIFDKWMELDDKNLYKPILAYQIGTISHLVGVAMRRITPVPRIEPVIDGRVDLYWDDTGIWCTVSEDAILINRPGPGPLKSELINLVGIFDERVDQFVKAVNTATTTTTKSEK